MLVAIVDCGSGNLRSVQKAFERAAREQAVTADVRVTSDPEIVAASERIVLPGVGAFRDCRTGLDAVSGLWQSLEEQVVRRAKPFLGICVGMQLLASRGLEFGETEGFGWIRGLVRKLAPGAAFKIPHMGWNSLKLTVPHPLFAGVRYGEAGPHAYFVHSFEFIADDAGDIVATTDYGGPVVAAVARGNIAGAQFHPEKSQKLGLNLLGNFLHWRP
ncbi:MAG: imidazole glycerol phosphate synthase subunit HisH [Pseudomonadota bacterium]|nr:imidazole glycerol phosphate synthase subunit HisH [Pseudomonadota bacterium]